MIPHLSVISTLVFCAMSNICKPHSIFIFLIYGRYFHLPALQHPPPPPKKKKRDMHHLIPDYMWFRTGQSKFKYIKY